MLRIGLLLSLLGLPVASFAQGDIWLLVDTRSLTLEVKKGNKTLEKMTNISIGRNGAGFKKHRGDNVTPLGLYKIGWINENSAYHRFFGLSYPSVSNAATAYAQGIIDSATYNAIVAAHNHHRLPPQNTKLGGRIGIHGLGIGNKKIHRMMNWTHGCIALTNHQIDRLSRWITKEIVVKVK